MINNQSMWTVTAAMKLKDTCSLEERYDRPRRIKPSELKAETSLCQKRDIVKAIIFLLD